MIVDLDVTVLGQQGRSAQACLRYHHTVDRLARPGLLQRRVRDVGERQIAASQADRSGQGVNNRRGGIPRREASGPCRAVIASPAARDELFVRVPEQARATTPAKVSSLL